MADDELEEGEAVPTPLTMQVASGGLSLLQDVNGCLSFNYTKLELTGKAITDLQDLHKFAALRLVNLSDNTIADVEQLAKLPMLLSAKLDNNQVTSIDNLSTMEALQLLSLKGNQIASMGSFRQPMLLYLHLDGNHLVNLPDTLGASTRLKVLKVSENKLASTAGIDQLDCLEEASFANNEITELVLGSMPQLTKLVLSDNQIPSLSSFASVTGRLEELDMGNNAVSSAKELAHLVGLQSLRTLTLAGNPVAEVDKYRNHVHAVLPNLASLDGEPWTEEDLEPPPDIVEEEEPAEGDGE